MLQIEICEQVEDTKSDDEDDDPLDHAQLMLSARPAGKIDTERMSIVTTTLQDVVSNTLDSGKSQCFLPQLEKIERNRKKKKNNRLTMKMTLNDTMINPES